MARLTFLLSPCLLLCSASFQDIVEKVNGGAHGWTAAVPTRFANAKHAATLCGTIMRDDPRYQDMAVSLPSWGGKARTDLPDAYDARDAHPACTVIGHVGDQSACGSCWAYSATQAAESVHCIAGGGDTLWSKQDTTECCAAAACGYSKSCTAGTPSAALRWIMHGGVVTGGDYNTTVGCKPYEMAPCSVDPTRETPFPTCHESNPPPDLQCHQQCAEGSSKVYDNDKQGNNSLAKVFGLNYRNDNQTHMMTALLENGPITAAFTVMEDFPAYRGGVYHHVTGAALGGHAITIVGWGVEDGVKYWTVKNSWSTYWGDEGFFRIRRGTNECGIEGQATGISYPSM